jgi:hypothetical protein
MSEVPLYSGCALGRGYVHLVYRVASLEETATPSRTTLGACGICPLQGPMERWFLLNEVTLYRG